MSSAIVLISGGLDSLVTAAIAINENKVINFLHVNYGQRTEAKELSCFQNICAHYQPQQSLIIQMDWLGKIGGSALTDNSIEIIDHEQSQGIPQTYVPFRNANLIAAAVSWAEVTDANRIYIGAVEEDSSGYPDCREVFFQNLQQTINTGIKREKPISIVTPIIHKLKSEIVKLGIELNAPFELSWSCYRDNDIACGKCDSCYLRLKAFKEAGIKDPLMYAE